MMNQKLFKLIKRLEPRVRCTQLAQVL
ncbi:hypothetical protein V12G01_09702 [Vibrio alginolyticus 12G01]|nr:hypothetical protein V12G01_09702 [Vibrio alginolyticus 12G01]